MCACIIMCYYRSLDQLHLLPTKVSPGTRCNTEVEIRFCGCAVICPSTPDFVQSHTLYVSTYSSFCLVIYILSGRLELCLLGSIAFFTTLLCTVDARQIGYKLEQL